ncbi:ribosomal protein S18-alanine N-acetyltransferase [Sphingomonas sp. GCM10030256]|uniref:ribosomal protein S18-alanine N-acetyltransferase n=1 Tax=Sphingomonas sp. GCM10030256 TaxID=3273427 RepID=UPI00360E17C9
MTLIQPAPVQLAPAGWSELDQVMDVMSVAFDDRYGEAWTRSQCAGILPMRGVRMIIARDGDTAIGFSLARTVADESELMLLAVSPQARRRGVGSALLDRFILEARSTGARRLHLEVRDGNPAVEMYHRHGFEIQGRRSKYYKGSDGVLHDALTMVRPASFD